MTAQQQKLVQLYYRDAISVEVMQAEQARIRDEQVQVERWQGQAIAQVDDVMEALEDALTLLSEPGKAYDYAESEPTLRKILNRAIFGCILIQFVDGEIEAEAVPQEVLAQLIQTAQALGLRPRHRLDPTAGGRHGPCKARTPTPILGVRVRTSTKWRSFWVGFRTLRWPKLFAEWRLLEPRARTRPADRRRPDASGGRRSRPIRQLGAIRGKQQPASRLPGLKRRPAGGRNLASYFLGRHAACNDQCAMGDVIDLLERPLYGLGQVDRLLGLRGGTARRWIEGYERSGKRYPPVIREQPTGSEIATWGEFVETRLLAQYRDAGVPLIRMRPAVDRLREELQTPYPLASARTWIDVQGRELVRKVQDEVGLERKLALVVVRTGQRLLEWTKPADEFRRSVEWSGEGAGAHPRLLHPVTDLAEVVIDPLRGFGEPVVANRGVRTEVIAELLRAGDSPEMIADLYELDHSQVQAAIRYELLRIAA